MIHDYGIADEHHGGIPRAVWESIVQDKRFSNFAKVGSIFYAEKNRKKIFIDFKNFQASANSPFKVYKWLSNNKQLKDKKTLFYGAGMHTIELLGYLRENDTSFYNNVVAILDDNIQSEDRINDKTVLSTDRLKDLDFDYVIPSTYDYENEVLQKIKERGIKEEKILPIYTNGDFISQNKATIRIVHEIEQIDSLF